MPSVHTNRGAKRAREARVAFGLAPGAPLGCLLTVVEQRYGVVVAALPEGVAGVCMLGLLWVNGREIPRRQRFTLAHELGHAWIGHGGAVDTAETLSWQASDPFEVEANAFAAEFLVPQAGLIGRANGGEPTLEDVVELAAEYGVSAPMMLVRLKQLALGSPGRLARLQREVDEGLHGYLGGEALDDRLARIDALPYLSRSLRGSLLDAAITGEAAVSSDLAGALERVMRPGRR